MDRLELTLEAPGPKQDENECPPATAAGWIDPVGQPRWVLLLGVEPDDETSG